MVSSYDMITTNKVGFPRMIEGLHKKSRNFWGKGLKYP
jgi:hypothetical protein